VHPKLSKEALTKISDEEFLYSTLKDVLSDQKDAYTELIKCLEIYIHVIFILK